ncbi:MAG: alkene reductase [Bacteroidota bacterium]
MPDYPTLFSPLTLGDLTLKNRVIMAPMTRSRAIGNVPNALMAEYYGQRADAGLLITEGTAPSPNGLGYARIPALFSEAQVEGWKQVTAAVHAKGGAIFAQVMHTGRVSHPDNMPSGAEVVAPSAARLEGEQMWTDKGGMQDYPTPRAMTQADIDAAIQEFVAAAQNAIAAGFDGVELHGANGYLIDQFINVASNARGDEYGGSVANRSRFALEVAQATADAIGAQRVGIRLSPYGVFNGMGIFGSLDATFRHLAEQLGQIGLAYIHLVDHSAMGAPEVPTAIKTSIRDAFGGPIIISGGYDAERAEQDLADGLGHLVAFGRPFLANPDLVERFRTGAALNEADSNTFYTPGPEGYLDYPTLDEQA